MKLSSVQQRAYAKLTKKWKSAYTLQESLTTLRVLVSWGLAESVSGLGAMFSPRTSICFRRKETNNGKKTCKKI